MRYKGIAYRAKHDSLYMVKWMTPPCKQRHGNIDTTSIVVIVIHITWIYRFRMYYNIIVSY